jgi:cholesterol transport system auxiliary component
MKIFPSAARTPALTRARGASLALVASLLLAACAVGGRAAPPTVYDFGPPLARALIGGGEPAPLRIAVEVRAPSWLELNAIDYRLAYADPLRLREYSGSRWAAPPPQLLAQRLRQQLGAAAATSNAALNCILRIDLQEFMQVFDKIDSSHAVLQAEASLIDARRQIVGAREFALERPAATADAAGGAAALVGASNALGSEVGTWLGQLDAAGRLGTCRAASAAPSGGA